MTGADARRGSDPVESGIGRLAPSEPSRPAWLMLALAWLAYAYFGVLVGALPALLATIERDLALSRTQSGALLGVFPVLYVVAAYAIGRIGDRVGVNRTAVAGILVITASSFLRAPAGSFVTLLLATGLLGIGGPVVSTVLPKLVAEWFTGRNRTVAAGVYTTGPAVGGGLALALTNSVLLPVCGSWQAVFVVYGFCGVGVLGAWLAFMQPRPPTSDRSETPAPPPTAPIWRSPAVWTVVLVGVAGFTIGHGFASWIPSILQSHGWSPGRGGLLASLHRVAQVVGALGVPLVASRLHVRHTRKHLVLASLAVAATGIVVLTVENPTLTACSLVAQGIASGALLPLLLSLLLDLPQVSEAESSTAAGLYFTVGQVAGSASPVVVGWLSTATGGFDAGIYAVAGIVAVTIVPALRLEDTDEHGVRTDTVIGLEPKGNPLP